MVSVGAYFHSKLELPPYVKLHEHVSIKLTSINHGSQTIIKTFKFTSSGQFDFLTHDGVSMVRTIKHAHLHAQNVITILC